MTEPRLNATAGLFVLPRCFRPLCSRPGTSPPGARTRVGGVWGARHLGAPRQRRHVLFRGDDQVIWQAPTPRHRQQL